jgi:type II secretory pathway pseudopilin PulG
MKPYQIPLLLNRSRRIAFTLVELMVAMALIILMLSIMSQAFVIATGTMQGLKEVADMQEKIRPAITLLQRDLGANHFEGSKKLSDPEFWDNGPPKEGYFMLWQDQAFEPAIPGLEPSGKEEAFPQIVQNINISKGVSFSRSAARANHMLSFTVKLPGKSPNEFFESSLGGAFGNIFFNVVNNPSQVTDTPNSMLDSNIRRFEKDSSLIHSDWAEVAYFLGPHNAGTVVADGNTDGKNNPPSLPYFNLYRQQRLVLPTPVDNAPNRVGYSELSFHPGEYLVPATNPPTPLLKFNSPNDLTVPWKRMGNRTNVVDTPLSSLPQPPPPIDLGLNPSFSSYRNHYLGSPQNNKPLFSEFANTSNNVNTDIIATNVISFDVKLLTDDQYDYETLNAILNRAPYSLNPAVGNYLPSLVFDTWTTDQGNAANSIPKYDLGELNTIPNKWQPSIPASSATIPVWGWYQASAMPNVYKPYKGIQIKAVQISLRIWDQKSNTAKMFVVVQKL